MNNYRGSRKVSWQQPRFWETLWRESSTSLTTAAALHHSDFLRIEFRKFRASLDRRISKIPRRCAKVVITEVVVITDSAQMRNNTEIVVITDAIGIVPQVDVL